jgi:hypothetical protein
VPEKHRGQLVSLATEQDQTLFFDYLPLDIGDVKGFKTKFQLYTVPGQVFYNATRKLVLRSVDGVVFVADSQDNRLKDNIDSLKNLRDNLREYGIDLDQIPFVIQYNKRDLPNAMPVAELEPHLNPGKKCVQFEAVATEGAGIRETLREIASQVLKRLNESANIISDEEIVGERLGVLPPLGEDKQKDSSQRLAAIRKKLRIESSQRSRWTWHGIGIGSGKISISTLDEGDSETRYQLVSDHRILGVRRSMVRSMKYIGEDRRSVDGLERIFHLLRDVSHSSRDGAPISAFVEKAPNPRVYLVYAGMGGEVKVGPEGETQPF